MIYRSFLPSGIPTSPIHIASHCRPRDYKLQVGNRIGIHEKFINKIKENIKNELKKDLKCEIDDKVKDELENNIEDKIDKELMVKMKCGISKTCQFEEKIREIVKEDDYINVSSDAKLYTRDIINKLYPELDEGIIDKIKTNDYYVKQLGIEAISCDENGKEYPYVTLRGNMNAFCVKIPLNNISKESYNISQVGSKDHLPDLYASCKNHMFSDNAHLVSTKVRFHPDSIDKNKPVVVFSQSESLIIADKKTDRLVRKDGTVSDRTIDECRAFFDSDGKTTDCAESSRDCELCKEVIWDSSEVVPVFFI